MAERVSIFEVAPRDGLQNEKTILPTRDKIEFVRGLLHAGVRDLELGAFVRTDKVPQMADSGELFQKIQSGRIELGSARAWCLVPNRRGLEHAIESGATHFAVFTAATETFTRKNIGMSIQESLSEFREVIREAKKRLGKKAQIRGYVSTAFGCPFEGKVSPKQALRVVEKLISIGVDQISIGDTIGVATPHQMDQVMKPALRLLGVNKTAGHFHDTRGTALANALRSLELGVRVFDSSAGGLGGCPFAPGAAGNLATEDLVFMLNGMGFPTGIDLRDLSAVSRKISVLLKRPISSKYLQSTLAPGLWNRIRRA